MRHDDRHYREIDERYNETGREERLSLDTHDYPEDIRVHRELWEAREERDLDRLERDRER